MVAVLEVTTVASCSVRCKICPQDLLKKSYRKDSAHRLTYPKFIQAVDAVPKHVVIHFSGFVEPWLNPECTSMLNYVLASGYRVGVYTTCVGMGHIESLAQLLAAYEDQVDVICIHLPDGVNMTVETRGQEFIDALRAHGLSPEVMSMAPQDTGFSYTDRAGNVVSNLVRHKGPIRCSYTDPGKYDHNVMLPNGDIHVCCMDYGLVEPLGNLFESTWAEIQDGEPMKALRQANIDGDSLCRRCQGACPQ